VALRAGRAPLTDDATEPCTSEGTDGPDGADR